MNNKLESARERATPQPMTFASKGEWLQQQVTSFLQGIDPSLKVITRQKLRGEMLGDVTLTKDVMPLLNEASLGSSWGVLSLDKLVEWAYQNGYQSFEELRDDYSLSPLGEGYCTVEIACDPMRKDLIDAFAQGGISGLKDKLTQSGERIATDTPGIAEYFFGTELLIKLSGSLEALPKSFAPVIIGIVSSGDSLREEGWKRLAENLPKAILLRSQLVLVAKRN